MIITTYLNVVYLIKMTKFIIFTNYLLSSFSSANAPQMISKKIKKIIEAIDTNRLSFAACSSSLGLIGLLRRFFIIPHPKHKPY